MSVHYVYCVPLKTRSSCHPRVKVGQTGTIKNRLAAHERNYNAVRSEAVVFEYTGRNAKSVACAHEKMVLEMLPVLLKKGRSNRLGREVVSGLSVSAVANLMHGAIARSLSMSNGSGGVVVKETIERKVSTTITVEQEDKENDVSLRQASVRKIAKRTKRKSAQVADPTQKRVGTCSLAVRALEESPSGILTIDDLVRKIARRNRKRLKERVQAALAKGGRCNTPEQIVRAELASLNNKGHTPWTVRGKSFRLRA